MCWIFLTCICSLGKLITVLGLSSLISKLIFWEKFSPKYVFFTITSQDSRLVSIKWMFALLQKKKKNEVSQL